MGEYGGPRQLNPDTMLSIDLTRRNALVTGVTSGIGSAVAEKLARAGCHVAGCGRSAPESDGARAFLGSVRQEGREALYFQADLADPAGPVHFAEYVTRKWPCIDILISNAGRNIFKGAESCTEADWNECMQLDLAAHWRIAKACLPALRRAESPVVEIIGSNHAWHSIPGCFPYNVAKAGLLGLVQSLAIEWGPQIRSVGIAPGFIDTAGNQAWFDSFPDPEKERRRTEAMHPVRRIGNPGELGALCAFLASAHASFIAGTMILVDGGRSALMQDPA